MTDRTSSLTASPASSDEDLGRGSEIGRPPPDDHKPIADSYAPPSSTATAPRFLPQLLPSDDVNDGVYVGNAGRDAALDRGWLLGHFKDSGDPRHSEDVEIKWGVHPRGDTRARWVTGERRTTLLVLVSGRFRVRFPDRDVVLRRQGDYIVWGRGTDHSWVAEEESVVLTVRWPSVPGYAVTVEEPRSAS